MKRVCATPVQIYLSWHECIHISLLLQVPRKMIYMNFTSYCERQYELERGAADRTPTSAGLHELADEIENMLSERTYHFCLILRQLCMHGCRRLSEGKKQRVAHVPEHILLLLPTSSGRVSLFSYHSQATCVTFQSILMLTVLPNSCVSVQLKIHLPCCEKQ